MVAQAPARSRVNSEQIEASKSVIVEPDFEEEEKVEGNLQNDTHSREDQKEASQQIQSIAQSEEGTIQKVEMTQKKIEIVKQEEWKDSVSVNIPVGGRRDEELKMP